MRSNHSAHGRWQVFHLRWRFVLEKRSYRALSRADTLPVIRARHPDVADYMEVLVSSTWRQPLSVEIALLQLVLTPQRRGSRAAARVSTRISRIGWQAVPHFFRSQAACPFAARAHGWDSIVPPRQQRRSSSCPPSAGVASQLTPVATTEQRARHLGCSDVEGFRWRVVPRAKSGSRTSTSCQEASWMTVTWKWSLIVCSLPRSPIGHRLDLGQPRQSQWRLCAPDGAALDQTRRTKERRKSKKKQKTK